MTTKITVFIFLSIFILQMCCDNSKRVPTSGPFRALLVSVEDCRGSPSRPYMKDSPMIYKTFVNNNNTLRVSMLDGNITVLKEIKNVKTKIKSFHWRNSKWELNYLMNNLNCHGMVIHLFCVAAKIQYDRKKCMFLKGSYVFKNLDINKIQHHLASTMDYGLQRWRTEVFAQAGTLFCKEFDITNEPA